MAHQPAGKLLKDILAETGARHDVLMTIAREQELVHWKAGSAWFFPLDSARRLVKRYNQVHAAHYGRRTAIRAS